VMHCLHDVNGANSFNFPSKIRPFKPFSKHETAKFSWIAISVLTFILEISIIFSNVNVKVLRHPI
jgi:hypothetical protein